MYHKNENNIGLVGERIINAANKIAENLKKTINLALLKRDYSYYRELQESILEPIVRKHAMEERLVIQAYFDMPPENTPYLGPDDEIAGVFLIDRNKQGNFQKGGELIKVRNFTENNPLMVWFYAPVKKGEAMWSEVYYDPYACDDIVSYNIPLYLEGQLAGVVGLDLSYSDFRNEMNALLVEELKQKLDIVNKQHEALGQKDSYHGQYLRLDTMEIVDEYDFQDGMITRSKIMIDVMHTALKVALSTANILILGETGVGKDYLASFIHAKSTVSKGPFINVNCSAIPESLMESEFFGYEKGAFTGAKIEGKPGYFELANGGTIFLNEIGDLPMQLQVKLLNVIQQKQVTRVGGTKPHQINFRVIAATNRNLGDLVSRGLFREDLYYRLNVIPIYLPPLRERREDILSLLNYFLIVNAEKYSSYKSFSPETIEVLSGYDWPGNIRQLENVVERIVLTTEGMVIEPLSLPAELLTKSSFFEKVEALDEQHDSGNEQKLADLMRAYEKQIFIKAWKAHGSSYKVARALGISQSSANNKIREYINTCTN